MCGAREPTGGREGSHEGEDESRIGQGAGVFLVRTTGTWGEQMFSNEHFFSVSAAGMVGGCPEWPISGHTD